MVCSTVVLQESNGEIIDCAEALSLVHVLPQAWYWMAYFNSVAILQFLFPLLSRKFEATGATGHADSTTAKPCAAVQYCTALSKFKIVWFHILFCIAGIAVVARRLQGLDVHDCGKVQCPFKEFGIPWVRPYSCNCNSVLESAVMHSTVQHIHDCTCKTVLLSAITHRTAHSQFFSSLKQCTPLPCTVLSMKQILKITCRTCNTVLYSALLLYTVQDIHDCGKVQSGRS